jgi:hypothetical protein
MMRRFLDRLALWWLSGCRHPAAFVARLYAADFHHNIEWCGSCGAFRRSYETGGLTDVGVWWPPRAMALPKGAV